MDQLLRELIAQGVLKSPRIIAAFQRIRREDFLPPALVGQADVNAPLPIGHGQTISQPLTVALMLELLEPQSGERVLDVGAGSGWAAALLAACVGKTGRVIALERIPALAQQAREHLRRAGITTVEIVIADGSRGWQTEAPYQCIHVAAAARKVPLALPEQLAIGGRLVIPVGQDIQDLVLLRRTDRTTWQEQRIHGFQFVPLIEDHRHETHP